MNLGQEIIKKKEAMASERSSRMTHWNELSPIYTNHRDVYQFNDTDINPGDWQFDSTPKQAVLTCANGLASLIFPREEPFSEYAPPMGLKGQAGYDDAVRWCREVSAIHQAYLQNSNFWEENQEGLTELPVFGTMALFCGGYDEIKDELYFRNIPIGTYYIAENYKGYVDTLYRELQYTANQAAEEYGEDSLPHEIRCKVGKAEGATEKFTFIHAVEPRKQGGKKRGRKNEKPYISVVVYEKTRKVVQEDGFDSFPYAVVRFRKQRNNPWGWGPASTVLGDARQLSKLNELADVATEISVFPPVEAHPDMEGSIDMGALGINYKPPGFSGDAIRQLPIQNRLDQTQFRIDSKTKKIEDAFFVNLFLMLNNQARQPGDITAFQANEMLGERAAQFSPVYGRMISEGGDIIMRRNFESLLAAGKFPQPPQAMLDVTEDGTVAGLVEPSILYKNRIVMALQQQKNQSIPQVLGLANQILSTNPELAPLIFAGLEPAVMFRDGARNAGFPEEWLPTDSVLKQRVTAIAEQQAQQQEAAMMQQGANTLGELGKAPQGAIQGVAQAVGA